MEQNQNNLFSSNINQFNPDSEEKTKKNYENNSQNLICPSNIEEPEKKEKLFGDFFIKQKEDMPISNENIFDKNEKKENKSLFTEKVPSDFFKNSSLFGNTELFGAKVDKSLNKNDNEIIKLDKENKTKLYANKNLNSEDEEKDESSSSNYNPEKAQLKYLNELLPYISSDSMIEEEEEVGEEEEEEKNDKKEKEFLKTKRKKFNMKKKERIKKNKIVNDISSGYNSENDDSCGEKRQLFKNEDMKKAFKFNLFNEINNDISNDKNIGNINLFEEKDDKPLNQKDNEIIKSDIKEENQISEKKENKNYNKINLLSEEGEKEKKKKEEEEEKDKINIKFSKKYKKTNNPLSINYYTKETKLETINEISKLKYHFFLEFSKSKGCFLLYNKEKLCFYDSLTKTSEEKKIRISSIKQLPNDYFIIIDCMDNDIITIFHFDITKNDFIIDQTFYLPEQKELDIHGPFAPYLSCYPLNESFIIFHWNTANNFYLYKNKSSKKEEFKFENFGNFSLEKAAYIYINTKLEKILKINKNEFLIFAVSDQRPEPNSMLEAFMRGGAKHKETTYIGIYSYDEINDKYILKKSKVNYEKNSGYGSQDSICILRERFLVYSGDDRTKKKTFIQIFDLKVMELITVIKGEIYKFKYFKIKNKNSILFLIDSNSNSMKQFKINENGHLKQIGKIKIKYAELFDIKENGIIYKENDYSYYLFKHE